MSKCDKAPDQACSAEGYKVLSTISEYIAIENSWRLLDKNNYLPTQNFNWIKASIFNFFNNQELKIIVYEKGNKISAILPLVVHNDSHGVKYLRMPIVMECFEPIDLVWADRHSLDRLSAMLPGLKHPIILDRLPADSFSVAAIKDAFRRKGVVFCRTQEPCPFISLDKSWEVPEQKLSSRRRYDLGHARRRAEKIGPLRVEVLSPGLKELDHLLDLAFTVEASSWKGEARTALAFNKRLGNFFKQFARYCSSDGILRICFLYIGNQAAAMQLAIEWDNRFWLFKIGYDNRFRDCSPGNLLMRETIKYAAEKRLSSYEFLGTVESWTKSWTNSVRRCITLRAYPFNVRGVTALGCDLMQALFNRVREITPS